MSWKIVLATKRWRSNILKLNTETAANVGTQVLESELFERKFRLFEFAIFSRPLAIQEVLRNAGSVLYVSPSQRFISGNLTKYLDFARNGEGISAWPTQRRLPTTSMTHPNMFDVFLRQTQFQGMNAADPAKEAGSPVDIADYQVWPLKNCWFLFYQPYSCG